MALDILSAPASLATGSRPAPSKQRQHSDLTRRLVWLSEVFLAYLHVRAKATKEAAASTGDGSSNPAQRTSK
ncbi:hypothetical protein FRC08_005406 [Ceratobasidium sp. 394]|nr:hypothetical protein FRC08_005406 [Ceratobasidium sp. 394]